MERITDLSYEDEIMLIAWFVSAFNRDPRVGERSYFQEWVERYKQGPTRFMGYMDDTRFDSWIEIQKSARATGYGIKLPEIKEVR